MIVSLFEQAQVTRTRLPSENLDQIYSIKLFENAAYPA